jgi:hypothetical protein
MTDSAPKIIVAGDVSIDWMDAPVSYKGKGATSNWQLSPGTRMTPLRGGALLLADLVAEALSDAVMDVVTHQLPNQLALIPPDQVIHSLAQLHLFPVGGEEKSKVYRVAHMRGYAGPLDGSPKPLSIPGAYPPHEARLVVLDDAGNGFRDAEQCWPTALQHDGQPVIIYKMSRPLAEGKLWKTVVERHADRLVAVVSANDLRAAGVNISRRLSWERTAKDCVWQSIYQRGVLSEMFAACNHLVIGFGVEGVIYFRRENSTVEARLYYDSKLEEDGFLESCSGKMLGLGSAFTAAMTARIARDGLARVGDGIREGLRCARRLFQRGFGSEEATELAYPIKGAFADLQTKEPYIAETVIPWPTSSRTADPEFWCILRNLEGHDLEKMAVKIVLEGEAALADVPIGQFGSLKTIDRREIESFRSIKNLMGEYLERLAPKRPLSIAVFGPPGSGKSVGVTQIAKSIAPEQVEKIEFNLAQFTSLDDLVRALHRVRNINLRGKTPLVFFDEFDATFGSEKLGWLKYFLAPMQDGEFKDGETSHPIGKAIFVFAGGTNSTYQEFYSQAADRNRTGTAAPHSHPAEATSYELGDRQVGDARQQFITAKGPDFVSRLRGYVNIIGPNPASPADQFFSLRRAMALRFQIKERAKDLFEGEGVKIDQGVLRALLRIPEYKHGLRSMEAILDMSLLSECETFEQAALPPVEQLELHVNGEMFAQLLARDVPLRNLLLFKAREELAQKIYQDQSAKRPSYDPGALPWEHLPEKRKEAFRREADTKIAQHSFSDA